MYRSAFGRTFFGSKKHRKWTEEDREKHSEHMKEAWAKSPERHEMTSELMTNTLNEYYKTHRNYWYGKKKTPEQIAKAVEACKKSNEIRRQEKIAKGELVWDDYNEKYVRPEDLPKRPKFKNVRCIETGVIYKTHVDAAKDLGLRSTLVRKVLNGNQKATGGYHFEVVEKDK